MSGWVFRALGLLPARARRGVMVALPLLLLATVVAAFALAPSGPGMSSRPAASSARLLPPSSTTATQTGARPARPTAGPGQSPAAQWAGQSHRPRKRPGAATRRRPARGPVSEQPPAPSPRGAEGMMLAVARRFAVAYMPYQIGRLPLWARTAIKVTCTPGFAHYLLAQPVQPTPLQAAHPKTVETYRVASVEPAGTPDTVAVSYVSQQASADTGEFLLRLVKEHGRWLVAHLEA
jgi:hypothetical protein